MRFLGHPRYLSLILQVNVTLFIRIYIPYLQCVLVCPHLTLSDFEILVISWIYSVSLIMILGALGCTVDQASDS